MKKYRWILMALTLLPVLLFIAGCNKEITLNSSWASAGIDGVESDSLWTNARTYFLEGQRVDIGLQNDENNLYIMLKSFDRDTRMKIMRAGFTVWLDATGQDKKSFGIHYPLGAQFNDGPPSREEWKSSDSTTQDTIPRRWFEGRYPEVSDTIEIVGPSPNDSITVPGKNEFGIAASLGQNSAGAMVYRLKVPLKRTNNSPYAIGAEPGSLISLGFESGRMKYEMPKGKRPPRQGEPGGGNGGGWGESGGGMGGPPGGGYSRERRGALNLEPIEFWAKLVLATAKAE